jgi:transcriptional regulator with XRE-family HTH domain
MRAVKDPRVAMAHDVDKYVGARVRERRRALDISQIKLGLKLGLTFQQVQKYERGSNRISASKLFQIAEVLQVPIEWFFKGYQAERPDKPGDKADRVHAFLETREGTDLGEAYVGLPSDDLRKCVLALLKSLAVAP